jgi:hypothetical protein
MSQPDQNASQVLFTGPTFHVSGIQIVAEAGEVSLYFTSTRHAFSANVTQVRTVNEVVARVIVTPPRRRAHSGPIESLSGAAGTRKALMSRPVGLLCVFAFDLRRVLAITVSRAATRVLKAPR